MDLSPNPKKYTHSMARYLVSIPGKGGNDFLIDKDSDVDILIL
ncbi:MAG: hypothetical protein CM15mP56_2800 [Alphaproteobacteria bacterium]|nr:MAG: hypothetical protein CM15mP56_2800 [Alphaproteobacteria bacterium]